MMPEHAKTPARRRAFIDLASPALIIAGGALLLGGYAYRVFLRPEMPSPEAMAMLWPVVLAGTAALLGGWLIDLAED